MLKAMLLPIVQLLGAGCTTDSPAPQGKPLAQAEALARFQGTSPIGT